MRASRRTELLRRRRFARARLKHPSIGTIGLRTGRRIFCALIRRRIKRRFGDGSR